MSLAIVLGAALTGGSANAEPGIEAGVSRQAVGDYALPVSAAVVQAFDDVGPYAPGHRGVDLAASTGLLVRSPAAGVITFAGQVAGRGLVVVTHNDGLRSTLEPVDPTVAVGDLVIEGAVLGAVAEGPHGDCAPGACLHWGVRRGDAYVDPLRLLTPLGPVRLVPIR